MVEVCHPKAPSQITIRAMLLTGDRRTQPEWRNIGVRKECARRLRNLARVGGKYPRQSEKLTKARWFIREDEQ